MHDKACLIDLERDGLTMSGLVFLDRSKSYRSKSYGRNAERLIKAKWHYDPDNVFLSAIPLPVDRNNGPARVAANARSAPAPEDA
jgi:Berberine and berberine like